MDGLSLLVEARQAGLTVWAADGQLHIRGPREQEALARQLLDRKAEVLQLLAKDCPHCHRPLDPKGRCWRCNYRTCTGCGRDSGSAFIELCVCCGCVQDSQVAA
jgi:hypothetical protein